MRTIRLSQKQTNYPPNKIHSLGNDIKQYFTLEYRNIKLRQKNTQNLYISNTICVLGAINNFPDVVHAHWCLT